MASSTDAPAVLTGEEAAPAGRVVVVPRQRAPGARPQVPSAAPTWRAATLALVVELAAVVLAAGAAVVLTEGWVAASVATSVWGLLAYSWGSALRRPVRRSLRPLGRATAIVLAVVAVIAVISDVPQHHQRSAVVAVLSTAVAAAVVRVVSARWAGPVRVVLVGHHTAVTDYLRSWSGRRDVKVVSVSTLGEPSTAPGAAPFEAVQRCRSVEDLSEHVALVAADLVAFLPGPAVDARLIRRAAWALDRSPVTMLALGNVGAIDPRRLTPACLAGEAGCELAPPRPSALMTGIKHTIDRFAATLLLLALAPVIALLAVGVRLDSAGPCFFVQTRVGRDGRRFRMYKVRTMVVEAERIKESLASCNEADGMLFKMCRDPRVTRLGRFLRRTSLDELPQLLNVIRGEMSLIGPRPLLPSEVAGMEPDALRRLVVRPGMTGLWQVSGRCELGWEESTRLDTHYVDNWSLLGDLQIAARTVGSVMSQRGAW